MFCVDGSFSAALGSLMSYGFWGPLLQSFPAGTYMGASHGLPTDTANRIHLEHHGA